jgi:hypothetical protein
MGQISMLMRPGGARVCGVFIWIHEALRRGVLYRNKHEGSDASKPFRHVGQGMLNLCS